MVLSFYTQNRSESSSRLPGRTKEFDMLLAIIINYSSFPQSRLVAHLSCDGRCFNPAPSWDSKTFTVYYLLRSKKKMGCNIFHNWGLGVWFLMASVAMGLVFRSSFLSPPQPTTRSNCHIASSTGPPTVSTCSMGERKKLPILLFDVMDTIVRDPFYEDVPAFFGMPMKELLEAKHPTAWGEFEEGLINESELASKFFKDGRPLDLQGLKDCMRHGYSYLSGMQMLLQNLKESGYEMHAFTNYPVWYMLIEEELKLSAYLNWTFCSCFTGKRKPDAHAYLEAIKQLGVHSSDCIFIDDRIVNVKAAVNAGMAGIHFKNASALEHDLLLQGVHINRK